MSEQQDSARRRVRRRPDTEPATPPPRRPAERPERGLRGLVGAGPTQVSGSAGMRARDAARPTDEDLAAAEAELQIVRRHYVPPGNSPDAS